MVATNAQKEFRHVRKATVLQDSTGEAIRVGGYRPDKKSRSSNKFGAERCPKHEMPEIVDLRTFMSPVENQRDSNSCTANAIAGAYEYLENRIYGQVTDVSRLLSTIMPVPWTIERSMMKGLIYHTVSRSFVNMVLAQNKLGRSS